jgi:hypothetical protein
VPLFENHERELRRRLVHYQQNEDVLTPMYHLRTQVTPGRVSLRRALAVAFGFALVSLSGCVTTREAVSQNEDHLAAAGFLMRPASTPERQEMLNHLPPHRFVQRTHGDTVHYVYADPLVCDCLYVGSQQAYSKYKQYLQQKQLADEQETTAQLYSDPAWNWGAWGPWGPGYGFMYGPGIGW